MFFVFSHWILTGLSLASSPMYDAMVTQVSSRYLKIDDLDVEEAFAFAAEEAEGDIPWLIVEPEPGGVVLKNGHLGEPHHVGFDVSGTPETAVLELSDALVRLEQEIGRLDGVIPEDLDLSVSLVKGAARSLDRHSVVMAKDRLQRFDERIRGRLTGIGARIGREDGQLMIREVFKGAPSEMSGLQADDAIIEIDGFSTIGMSVNQAVERIRGAEGTVVVLTVQRMGSDGPETVVIEMTRAVVVIPNVTWRKLDSGVGYMAIENFSEQTSGLMTLAMEELALQSVSGMVLDLRGNTGGSMKQSCKAADLFLESGVVLTTEGRNGAEVRNLMRQYNARTSGLEPDFPLVVLMDSYSASASEILGGVLQDHQRALLVGSQSHGKGTVQKVYTIRGGDDSERVRFKLTVAEFLVAGERRIEAGVGIEPDLAVNYALFGREGVRLPKTSSEGAGALTYVEELPGWLEQDESSADRDFVLDVGEQIVLQAQSGSHSHMLDSMALVERTLRKEEESRLIQTFAKKGIDWSAAETAMESEPNIDVQVSVVGDLLAGNEVEVQATVTNRGVHPLHRLQISLVGEERSPWDGLQLPIGRLDAGETAKGTRRLTLDLKEASRMDEVTPIAQMMFASDVELAATQLEIQRRPAPHLAVDAQLVENEGGLWVELQVDNQSDEMLTDLTASLALSDDAPVAIRDRFGKLDQLLAKESGKLVIGIDRLREVDSTPIELELRIAVEFYGRILQIPLELESSGQIVHLEQPRVSANLPLALPVGIHHIPIEATDDGQIDSIRVWLDGEKIAWIPGNGPELRTLVPIQVDAGSHQVHVQVFDDQGSRRTRLYRVKGQVSDLE